MCCAAGAPVATCTSLGSVGEQSREATAQTAAHLLDASARTSEPLRSFSLCRSMCTVGGVPLLDLPGWEADWSGSTASNVWQGSGSALHTSYMISEEHGVAQMCWEIV